MLSLLPPSLDSLIQMHFCLFLATKKYKIQTLVSEEVAAVGQIMPILNYLENCRETCKQVCKLIHNNMGEFPIRIIDTYELNNFYLHCLF